MPTLVEPSTTLSSSLLKFNFENRNYLVEEPAQFNARTKQLLDRAQSLGKIVIPNVQPHVAVSLAQYQTPIRDQQDRGTCWAFAGVAGMEALYKRKYGVSLDLSEQYVASMEKCGELYPDYVTNGVPHENNSSFWDAQGGSDIAEKLERMAVPEERFAPYLNQSQLDAIRKSIPASGALDGNSTQEQLDAFEFSTANIPLAARQNAIYRATGWQAIGSPTTDALEKVLTAGHEVVIDLNLKWKFDSTKNAYDYDPTSSGGGHCTLLIGFDHTSQIFTIKNSWGGTAYLQVTYNFIQNCCSSGHYFTDVCDPKSPAQKLASWIGTWNMDHDGWRGSLVIRRFTDFRNSNAIAPTKLGNYYRDGARHDVNGYFSADGQNMVFWIADGTNRIQPGTETGQQFQTYIFSWDLSDAAGRTTWQNIPFGVVLKRAAIPAEPSAAFQINDWLGTYAMNHDGWQGKLTVQSINPFKAAYVDNTGKSLPVTGSVNGSHTHEVSLAIQFAANNQQQFDLLHHTRERGIFAGTTVWAGHTYGVQGLLS